MKTNKLFSILCSVVLLLSFVGCKKTVNNYFEPCKMVQVTFETKDLLVSSEDLKLRAAVSRADAEGFQFNATKPTIYHAYFIVGNEVIHTFNNIIEGSQTVTVQERPYDKIIVSSEALTADVLRNYNNDDENLNKLIYNLPVTSENLVLAGEVYRHDVRQSKNITVVVQNYYSAVIFFNADNVKTQDDVSLLARTTPAHHFLYIKDRNLTLNTVSWNQGFKYQVNNTWLNITSSLEPNRVYKFFINRDAYGTTDGNFTVVVGDLFVKPVSWKDLPGRQ